MITSLYTTYINKNRDVIIWSSMSGFTGYYLASISKSNNIELIVTDNVVLEHTKLIVIISGNLDAIIKA